MHNYEQLGAFYLGKQFDLDRDRLLPDLLMYDAKDLTTHAVCVGMTGSGKTGLCLSLLEEAGMDGIPAIAIDPKGDLGNLLLTFPQLKSADFRPWIEEAEATRQGLTPDQFAKQVARQWRDGLQQWGQDGDRIARFREAIDLTIYTPGSNAGLPLAVLHSFSAPPATELQDPDALRERVSTAASGILALLGLDADPIRSREHILLSNIFHHAWTQHRNLDIAMLIREIQQPPFQRVGVMDLETFFPTEDRFALSMQLNNLVASPSFASWTEGEPLSVKRLLYTPQGKPRLSIISIAHLSEPERMFFVTILLNEVLAWTRSQPGTSSLRALLYMDEVFGYFPPISNPPSKRPMLTLLKQARAHGVGVVLATQNPVDLDYKGLSNAGTWLLGRLQTDRDKQRVLDGLEGAATATGSAMDRKSMESALSNLGNRVFVMNNVHDDGPVVFQTRWAMSYLRGPLTRQQIQQLTAQRRATSTSSAPGSVTEMPQPVNVAAPLAAPSASAEASRGPITPPGSFAAPATSALASAATPTRPIIPPEANEAFLFPRRSRSGRLVYRPALLGIARCHFVRSSYGNVDIWKTFALLQSVSNDDLDDVWDNAQLLADGEPDLSDEPDPQFAFSDPPADLTNARKYRGWSKDLVDYLYRNRVVTVWKCSDLKSYSEPDEGEDDFRIRLQQVAKEKRDLAVEKLRKKYAKQLESLKGQILRAEQRVGRETDQYRSSQVSAAISFGTSILGAMFGRKLVSQTNVRRAGSSMRSASSAVRQRGDIGRAKESLEALQHKLEELEEQAQEDIEEIQQSIRVDQMQFEELHVRPRKSDIKIDNLALVWTPWSVDAQGIAEPIF